MSKANNRGWKPSQRLQIILCKYYPIQTIGVVNTHGYSASVGSLGVGGFWSKRISLPMKENKILYVYKTIDLPRRTSKLSWNYSKKVSCVCAGQLDVEIDRCIYELNINVKRSITYPPKLLLINNRLRVTCFQDQPVTDMLIEKLTSIKLYCETICRNK